MLTLCPLNVATLSLAAMSHTPAVWSSEKLTRLRRSEEKSNLDQEGRGRNVKQPQINKGSSHLFVALSWPWKHLSCVFVARSNSLQEMDTK